MGLMDGLKQLQEGLSDTILEPDRPKAFVAYLASLGYRAEIEWVPKGLMEANAGGGACCMGRIRLANNPIDRIELRKHSAGSNKSHSQRKVRRTVQSIRYIDHFLIDAPGEIATANLSAKRTAKKAFLIAGRVTGYPWSGGPLGQQLEADTKLAEVLDTTAEKELHIRHDGKAGVIMMTRPYSALTSESIQGLAVQGVGENVNVHVALPTMLTDMLRNKGEVEKNFGFPSQKALKCFERIARHARKTAGLPDVKPG